MKETFVENLKKRFFNTYKFSNHDINKFILLLQKAFYPYRYMDDWETFSETSLPEKEETIWYQKQIIILQDFSQKMCWL